MLCIAEPGAIAKRKTKYIVIFNGLFSFLFSFFDTALFLNDIFKWSSCSFEQR